jgi:hypothetical protein
MIYLFHILVLFKAGTKRWEHERAKWISGCHQTTKLQQQQGRSCETPSLTVTRDLTRDDSNKTKAKSNVNIEEVVSMLFSNRWDNTTGGNSTTASNRFPNPVPLPLMVEILVDVWEAEGLDM